METCLVSAINYLCFIAWAEEVKINCKLFMKRSSSPKFYLCQNEPPPFVSLSAPNCLHSIICFSLLQLFLTKAFLFSFIWYIEVKNHERRDKIVGPGIYGLCQFHFLWDSLTFFSNTNSTKKLMAIVGFELGSSE